MITFLKFIIYHGLEKLLYVLKPPCMYDSGHSLNDTLLKFLIYKEIIKFDHVREILLKYNGPNHTIISPWIDIDKIKITIILIVFLKIFVALTLACKPFMALESRIKPQRNQKKVIKLTFLPYCFYREVLSLNMWMHSSNQLVDPD